MKPTVHGDPLHGTSPPDLYWTTSNAGEAVPGVQTPLSLAAWRAAGSRGFEAAGRAIGVLAPDESLPAPAVHAFYGHAVMSVDFLRIVGERMPGADGPQVVSGLVGQVPEGMVFAPTRARHLAVAWRFPVAFVRVPGMLERLVAEQNAWWAGTFAVPGMDEAGARRFLETAVVHHERATVEQCIAVFTGVQPVHDTLERVLAGCGLDGSATASVLTAPVGGAEMEVVADLWRASRGELTAADVVAAHGFHGPLEGELSARVWREDDGPVRALIERYAARPDADSPLAADAERAERRRRAERELLAAAPLAARPAVRALLGLARRRLRLRGVNSRRTRRTSSPRAGSSARSTPGSTCRRSSPASRCRSPARTPRRTRRGTRCAASASAPASPKAPRGWSPTPRSPRWRTARC
jgi:pyruvate,water dikinase